MCARFSGWGEPVDLACARDDALKAIGSDLDLAVVNNVQGTIWAKFDIHRSLKTYGLSQLTYRKVSRVVNKIFHFTCVRVHADDLIPVGVFQFQSVGGVGCAIAIQGDNQVAMPSAERAGGGAEVKLGSAGKPLELACHKC